MEPGDVVFFHFRTVHGARGNAQKSRRRALSLRWVGDDARSVHLISTGNFNVEFFFFFHY